LALGYAVPGRAPVNCCIAGVESHACLKQRQAERHDPADHERGVDQDEDEEARR